MRQQFNLYRTERRPLLHDHRWEKEISLIRSLEKRGNGRGRSGVPQRSLVSVLTGIRSSAFADLDLRTGSGGYKPVTCLSLME